MKNFMVCVAFFVAAIGVSNITVAECDTPVRDRVSCVGCKAKVAVKRVSRSTMCRVQGIKSSVAKAVKSADCKLRRGTKKVMQFRPKVMRCCDLPTVEMGALMVPATIVLTVAVMPEVRDDLILEGN